MGKYDHLTREELITRLEQAEHDEMIRLQDRLDGEKRIADALMLMLKQYDGNYEEDILHIVLERYQADRAFIFKFDWQKNTNNNIYEVNAPGISSEIHHLQNLPNAALGKQLALFKEGIPLIVDDIDRMEEFGYHGPRSVKEVFQKMHLKSAILFPIHIFEELWGFVGMETIGKYKKWNTDDVEWLKSFTHILCIGIGQKLIRNSARRNERRFSELFENMPVGYVRHRMIYDENRRPVDYEYLEVNPAFEKLLHLSRDKCVGKRATQLLPHLDATTLQLYADVARTGELAQLDYYSPLHQRWFYSVLYSPKAGEFVALFYDITERYTATEKIRQNEKKLRTIFANLPIGIISYDAEGHFIDCNDEIFSLLNIRELQELGSDLTLQPSTREKANHAELLNIDFLYDIRLHKILPERTPATEHSKYLTAKIIQYADDNGACLGYLLIAIDNTKIRRANQQLFIAQKTSTENLMRLSMILETGEIYPWYLDIKTGELDITEDFFHAFKREKTDYQNYSIENLLQKIHPEDLPLFREKYENLRNGLSGKFKLEVRLNIFDHGYIWCELNAAARNAEGNGAATQCLGFLTVIQKRKDNELRLIEAIKKAEESDKLKSAFLANVSHEIRTPLNAIIGFSELIAQSQNKEEKKFYLEIVKTNNNLLLNLINDILDLSKIESGRIDLKETPVNLKDLCQELCQVHQLRAAPSVKVVLEPTCGPLHLLTDSNRINQLYSNLISNAIKNTVRGSITIGYTLRGDRIECYVRDTGKGIPKDKQAIIFNRFEKLDTSVQGFGLGLSICKSILEKMKGNITLRSEEGIGTEFRFSLPYRTTGHPCTTETEENTASSATDITLLVAENTDSNYEPIENALQHGYRLLRAKDGIEAITLFSSGHPRLVFLNLDLPDLDGIEVTRIMREVNPDIPILLYTTSFENANRTSAFEAGCTEILPWPPETGALKALTEKYTIIR